MSSFVRAVIMAGGEGTRLRVLTRKRAKPAVPFAGKYRIIDFTLSNCVNSGIFDVMVLTQYRPHSLHDHIGKGRPWDLDRSFSGGVMLLQPYTDSKNAEWYVGTADAVYKNMTFIRQRDSKLALILSGDHVYRMNYQHLIDFHEARGADVTICTIRVTLEEATRFGVLSVDEAGRVVSFVEKPKDPPSTLVSMGVYLFNMSVLERVLQEDADIRTSSHDFGKDIIPRMIEAKAKVYTYPFFDYWVDVGTVDAYWETHMDLLNNPPPIDLNDRNWVIHTKSEERPPVRIEAGARISDSLITDGSVIARGATVERSVLSPGVYIGPDAIVRESVIMTGSFIEAGAVVERAVIDKDCVIGHNAHVGEITDLVDNGIVTIGKGVVLPTNIWIGRGASLAPDLGPEHFSSLQVPADGYVHAAVAEL